LELSAPIQLDPSSLSPSELEELNISPLPSCASDALGILKSDDVILAALGKELARAYVGVKKAELAAMESLTFEQEVELLLDKY
jgi:glutamine synthetase